MHHAVRWLVVAAALIVLTGCAGHVRKTTVVSVGGSAPAARLAVLPSHHETVLLRGVRYYVVDGVFYRRHAHGYVVTRAPVGAVVRRLPANVRVVRLHGGRYYRVAGVYYRYDGRRRAYVVVDP